jgi:lipopolysaccharide heptosyltransferase I
MQEQQKILIVKLSAIGDVAQSTPILHALRRKFPDAHIAWAVEDRAADILKNNPLLDEIFIFPRQRWKKRGFNIQNFVEFWEIIKQIRKQNFNIAIDLQELFKSGIIAFLSGAKRRIAHAGTRELAHIFVNEKLPYHDNFDPNKILLERYLEPAAHLGAPIDEVQFSLPPVREETKLKVDEMLKDIDKDKEIMVFCPATIWKSKHWLEEYWAELLDKLSPRYNIIFIGTEGDKKLIERITSKAHSQNYFSLAGKTNIMELIELFYRTRYLISPDTGPAHIANATQHPEIIMLFGSTGVRRTPPYGEKHKALAVDLDCQPCFIRNCPKADYMQCMKELTPDMVLALIN